MYKLFKNTNLSSNKTLLGLTMIQGYFLFDFSAFKAKNNIIQFFICLRQMALIFQKLFSQ